MTIREDEKAGSWKMTEGDTTPRERNATPEEWAALIERVPPRIAIHLRSGVTAFTGRDGVKLRPPHGVSVVEAALTNKTTVTFCPRGEPS